MFEWSGNFCCRVKFRVRGAEKLRMERICVYVKVSIESGHT